MSSARFRPRPPRWSDAWSRSLRVLHWHGADCRLTASRRPTLSRADPSPAAHLNSAGPCVRCCPHTRTLAAVRAGGMRTARDGATSEKGRSVSGLRPQVSLDHFEGGSSVGGTGRARRRAPQLVASPASTRLLRTFVGSHVTPRNHSEATCTHACTKPQWGNLRHGSRTCQRAPRTAGARGRRNRSIYCLKKSAFGGLVINPRCAGSRNYILAL